MAVKYRIRLDNDRVIGPFLEDEIVELFQKNHISGSEMCQQFPIGEWKPIASFAQIYSKIEKIKIENEEKKKIELAEKKTQEEINQKAAEKRSLESTSSGIKSFKEFKFGPGVEVEVDYKELERKYKEDKGDNAEDDTEKTRIVKRKKVLEDIDKTVIRTKKSNVIEIDTLLKKQKEAEEKEKIEKELEAREKEKIIKLAPEEPQKSARELAQEQTQFIDLQEVLPSINAQLRYSEIEIDKQEKIQINQERFKKKLEYEKEIKEKLKSLEVDEILVPNEEGKLEKIKKQKKGMSWIVALAFIALIYVLLDSDEEVKKPLYIPYSISFPVTKEFENKAQAQNSLGKARALYAENTYEKRVQASLYFIDSVENQFDNNPALGEMLLNAVELMEAAKDPIKVQNIIYRIIKVSDRFVLKDVNVATASALFYGKIGKPNTGINIIKNYLRLGSRPSVKMITAYLELLKNSGDFVEARKAFEKIKVIPKKPIESYLALARFLEADEKSSEAESAIEEGLKYFPKSVPLLLKDAEIAMRMQGTTKFEQIINKLKVIGLESSPIYLADFLYYSGMLSALKGKNKEAAALFKNSLNFKENDELRMRLAELEIGGNTLSQNLILESKLITLVKRAKEEMKNKNWETAISLIAEATAANSNYIPAVIVQAELQISRGLFEAAIYTLSNVRENNPNNTKLMSLLVETYLKAYKLSDAQKLLIESAQTKFVDTSEYYYLYGLFFEQKGNLVYAVRYFEEALRRNPLEDKILFKMAQILYRGKKLKDAKYRLSEALILDPKNTDYLSLNAQIINEQDNPDTAIGYLRDVMSEIGEDPKLLFTITSIYFKTGQLKEFKLYYNKVQNLPKKDEGFYEYLISSAKLDGSFEEFEQYSKELIKINPGNLKIRMGLAEYFIEKNRFPDAINELIDIKERLPSYPRVNNLLARVYMAQGDMKSAKSMAELELKMNPELDSAFFIMGEVHKQNKDYREAVAHLEKAISKNPKSIEALMSLAWIRLNQNLAAEAMDLYTRVVKLEPTNSEAHRQLGYTYRSLGQRAIAKEKFEDYLKLNPGASDRELIEQIIRTLK